MIKVFGTTFTSSVQLRKALGLAKSKWCAKAEIADLLRCAFPELEEKEHVKNIQHFVKSGKFKYKAEPLQHIYKDYCSEYGCSLPFDIGGVEINTEKPQITRTIDRRPPPQVQQPIIKAEVKPQEIKQTLPITTPEPKKEEPKMEPKIETVETEPQNDLAALKDALLAELNEIRNTKNYTGEDGKVDPQKAEVYFRRAETVNNIAANINSIHQTEINSKRLQLDAVKTALSHGYDVKVQGNLLGVEIHEHDR